MIGRVSSRSVRTMAFASAALLALLALSNVVNRFMASEFTPLEGAVNDLCTREDGTVNEHFANLGVEPGMVDDLCYKNRSVQKKKLLWFVIDGMPIKYARRFLDVIGPKNLSVYTVTIKGVLYSHAIYSSWMVGSLTTNYDAHVVEGDTLIEAMHRDQKSRDVYFVGDAFPFSKVLGRSRMTENFSGHAYIKEPEDATDTVPHPMWFDKWDMEPLYQMGELAYTPDSKTVKSLPYNIPHLTDPSGQELENLDPSKMASVPFLRAIQETYTDTTGGWRKSNEEVDRADYLLRSAIESDASILAYTAMFDRNSHYTLETPPHSHTAPNIMRYVDAFEKWIPRIKKFVDDNPEYMLVLGADHGLDEYLSGGFVLHGRSANDNQGWIATYGSGLPSNPEENIEVVDVGPTLASFMGCDSPINSLGVTRARFGDSERGLATWVAALRRSALQLSFVAKQRGAPYHHTLNTVLEGPQDSESLQEYGDRLYKKAAHTKWAMYSVMMVPYLTLVVMSLGVLVCVLAVAFPLFKQLAPGIVQILPGRVAAMFGRSTTESVPWNLPLSPLFLGGVVVFAAGYMIHPLAWMWWCWSFMFKSSSLVYFSHAASLVVVTLLLFALAMSAGSTAAARDDAPKIWNAASAISGDIGAAFVLYALEVFTPLPYPLWEEIGWFLTVAVESVLSFIVFWRLLEGCWKGSSRWSPPMVSGALYAAGMVLYENTKHGTSWYFLGGVHPGAAIAWVAISVLVLLSTFPGPRRLHLLLAASALFLHFVFSAGPSGTRWALLMLLWHGLETLPRVAAVAHSVSVLDSNAAKFLKKLLYVMVPVMAMAIAFWTHTIVGGEKLTMSVNPTAGRAGLVADDVFPVLNGALMLYHRVGMHYITGLLVAAAVAFRVPLSELKKGAPVKEDVFDVNTSSISSIVKSSSLFLLTDMPIVVFFGASLSSALGAITVRIIATKVHLVEESLTFTAALALMTSTYAGGRALGLFCDAGGKKHSHHVIPDYEDPEVIGVPLSMVARDTRND